MGSDAKEIQRTIILEFPNLIPPVWWLLTPPVLTVKSQLLTVGKDRDIPYLFTPIDSWLFIPTFLAPPFQVAATCTSLNIGPWEGFFVLSASYGVT